MSESMNKEVRVFEGEVELREATEDSPGKLVGYAAVFNKKSEDLGGFREVIKPGAFSSSLGTTPDVRALVEHSGGLSTIGRTTNDTLQLTEDRKGLKAEITPPDTQTGRDVLELVRRGDLSQMSFAFTVRDGGDMWETNKSGNVLRTLTDVDLFDVSVVAYPAYPDTTVAKRSLEEWQADQAGPDQDQEQDQDQAGPDQDQAMGRRSHKMAQQRLQQIETALQSP